MDATIATPTNTEIVIAAIPEFCSLALKGTRSKKVHIYNPDFGGMSLCGLEGLISGCIMNTIDGNPNNQFTYVKYDLENKTLIPLDDCLNQTEDTATLKLCQKCVKELLSKQEEEERLLMQLICNSDDDNHRHDYHQGTERPFKLTV